MNSDHYDDKQQEVAREFAGKLTSFAERLRGHLCDQGIATAMIGVGVQAALASHETDAVADWLRGIADEIEQSPNGVLPTRN